MATRDGGREQSFFVTTILFIILSGVTILLTFGGGPLGSSGLALVSRTSNQIYVAAAMAKMPIIPGTNLISVKDQKLDLGVLVTEARMTSPGFLLIRKVSAKGMPDEIIGKSSYFGPGVLHNFQISFYTGANKPKLAVGDTLAITLARDNGDRNFDETDFKNIVSSEKGGELTAKFKLL